MFIQPTIKSVVNADIEIEFVNSPINMMHVISFSHSESSFVHKGNMYYFDVIKFHTVDEKIYSWYFNSKNERDQELDRIIELLNK